MSRATWVGSTLLVISFQAQVVSVLTSAPENPYPARVALIWAKALVWPDNWAWEFCATSAGGVVYVIPLMTVESGAEGTALALPAEPAVAAGVAGGVVPLVGVDAWSAGMFCPEAQPVKLAWLAEMKLATGEPGTGAETLT